jgi:hypothetical protein
MTGNHVNQYALDPAILLTTLNDGTAPVVQMSLLTNHVDMLETAPGSGIRGDVGTAIRGLNGNVCASMMNNISHRYPVGVNPQAGGILVTQAGTASFGLERGIESLSATAPAVVAANNPAPTLTVMVTDAVGAFSIVENGSCIAPAPGQ